MGYWIGETDLRRLEDVRDDGARGVDGHEEPVGLGRVGGAVRRRQQPLVQQQLEHLDGPRWPNNDAA